MDSKKNHASVKQVQYVKERLFELQQKINTNLTTVEQVRATLDARLELVAQKLADYNSVAERVNTIIAVFEQASVGLNANEASALPQRLPMLNKKDFGIE